MPHIAIISSSVRRKRNSHRVALYFKGFIEEKQVGTVSILDLAEYNFPIFDERLRLQESPTPAVLDFAEKIKTAESKVSSLLVDLGMPFGHIILEQKTADAEKLNIFGIDEIRLLFSAYKHYFQFRHIDRNSEFVHSHIVHKAESLRAA